MDIIPINNELGEHRLGLFIGKNESNFKEDLLKLNKNNYGILKFVGMGIYASWLVDSLEFWKI